MLQPLDLGGERIRGLVVPQTLYGHFRKEVNSSPYLKPGLGLFVACVACSLVTVLITLVRFPIHCTYIFTYFSVFFSFPPERIWTKFASP